MKEPKPCTCEICKKMCKRPCWPSPHEASKLISLGYADKMMQDYWIGKGLSGNINLVCPAEFGREKQVASFEARGGCVLQTEEGLCSIHNLCKPIEARMASCQVADEATEFINWHEKTARMWQTWEGEKTFDFWKRKIAAFQV